MYPVWCGVVGSNGGVGFFDDCVACAAGVCGARVPLDVARDEKEGRQPPHGKGRPRIVGTSPGPIVRGRLGGRNLPPLSGRMDPPRIGSFH